METELRTLTARLLAHRSMPRTDRLARRALVDDGFRHALDQRLAAVGLQLFDNPYAAHIAVGIADDMREPVFGQTREYAASNVGLMRDELAWLCDADVLGSFEEAIAAREAEGHVLDNRLVRIEKAQIVDASVNGRIAEVSLRFEADIAAVTRDKDGNVVAGSLTDAVGTNDIWTFTRDIRSADPNWKLSETDEAA